MNKRNFMKALLTAAVAPQVLLAMAGDRQRWKRTEQSIWTRVSDIMWVANPEWVNPPSETINYAIYFDVSNLIK